MKGTVTMSIVTLALSICSCDDLSRQVMPDARKLVIADGKVYMACAGSVEVQQTDNGYRVRLTDRSWNDQKTEYTDTEVYTQAKLITVRPLSNDELSIRRTGHFPSVSQTSPQAQKTPCEQWREAHPNDTSPCENK